MDQASKAKKRKSTFRQVILVIFISTQLSFPTLAILYKKFYTHITFHVGALSACMYVHCMHA